jgi:hypothetical protein
MPQWLSDLKTKLPALHRPVEPPAAGMPGFRRRDVVKHAWRHIKNSWRAALIGGLVTFVLPPLYEWWNTYDFSHKGLDEVTGGNWVGSIIAVAAWLAVVALWHLMRAPIGHAREVIAAHNARHEREIERVREEAKANAAPPQIGTYHAHGTTVLIASEELVRQIGSIEAKPTAPDPSDRPELQQEPQVDADQADHQADGAGDEKLGQ